MDQKSGVYSVLSSDDQALETLVIDCVVLEHLVELYVKLHLVENAAFRLVSPGRVS
jgi:hypothetical protein